MNQKTFITIGNRTINLTNLVSINFLDEEKAVEVVLEKSEHKFRFDDEKEFQRLKVYIRLFSSQFESGHEVSSEQTKKTILG